MALALAVRSDEEEELVRNETALIWRSPTATTVRMIISRRVTTNTNPRSLGERSRGPRNAIDLLHCFIGKLRCQIGIGKGSLDSILFDLDLCPAFDMPDTR